MSCDLSFEVDIFERKEKESERKREKGMRKEERKRNREGRDRSERWKCEREDCVKSYVQDNGNEEKV